MATLHDSNIGQGRKIFGYILSVIPSLGLLLSGTAKLLQVEMMQKALGTIGMGHLILLIGGIEVVSVILYWIPRTANLGFFLLASYSGGIIVAELAMGGTAIPGIPIAILLYAGTFLRKPSILG